MAASERLLPVLLHARDAALLQPSYAFPLYPRCHPSLLLPHFNLLPLCYLHPLQDVSSTEAAIIYTLEPVFGASLAYVMLGERWGTSGWVGAGLIVASCLAAQLMGVEDLDHTAKHDDPPAKN